MNNLDPKDLAKTTAEFSARFLEQIFPFQETRTDHLFELKNVGDPDENHANDLFAYFTANIIKEDVTFIR
jgi:hypothetical protein